MPEQDEGAFKIPSVALVFYALKDGSFLQVSWCFLKPFIRWIMIGRVSSGNILF